MRPCQIVNTRVHNLQVIETRIELTKVIQISLVERVAVFRHQLLCQCFNQLGAILCTGLPMLFFLHYPPSDVPIGEYRNLIDCCVCPPPTLFYDASNIIKEFIGCYIMMLQLILFHTLIL